MHCRAQTTLQVAATKAGLQQELGALAAMQGTGLLRGAAARAISTSTLASQALPALAADTPATQGSWISRLLGAVPREGTPLSDPLPGVTEVPPATFPSQPPETQLTTYPNGMKLASEDTPVRGHVPGGPKCSVARLCLGVVSVSQG